MENFYFIIGRYIHRNYIIVFVVAVSLSRTGQHLLFRFSGDQRLAMSIQKDEYNGIILIISDTYSHSYLFFCHEISAHIQSLKLSSYCYENGNSVIPFNIKTIKKSYTSIKLTYIHNWSLEPFSQVC